MEAIRSTMSTVCVAPRVATNSSAHRQAAVATPTAKIVSESAFLGTSVSNGERPICAVKHVEQ